MVQAAGSSTRASRALRRHRQPVRAVGDADPDAARARGAALAAALTPSWQRTSTSAWRVRSRLELQFERLYLKLFLPLARRGTRGARKRYVGSASRRARPVEFTGMEAVRRDWTALAKQVQRELYRRLFADQPVDAYLAESCDACAAASSTTSSSTASPCARTRDDYTATTPPHVAAARKSTQPPGGSIGYVITTAGPEPADNGAAPARPRALRREAGAPGRRARARHARAGLRARHRRQPPSLTLLDGSGATLGSATSPDRSRRRGETSWPPRAKIRSLWDEYSKPARPRCSRAGTRCPRRSRASGRKSSSPSRRRARSGQQPEPAAHHPERARAEHAEGQGRSRRSSARRRRTSRTTPRSSTKATVRTARRSSSRRRPTIPRARWRTSAPTSTRATGTWVRPAASASCSNAWACFVSNPAHSTLRALELELIDHGLGGDG